MHRDNNAIEEDCNWAIPSHEKISFTDEMVNNNMEKLIELF
jgi:hypothetical protein